MKLRLRHLVLFAPLALVQAVSAHAAPKSKKPSKPTRSSAASKSAPPKPIPSKGKARKAKKAKKAKKGGSAKSQSKPLPRLTKEAFIQAAAGELFEIRSTMVLTPAQPKRDSRNYLSAAATGPMAWAPGRGRDGLISIDGPVGYWHNYASLRFQAAPDQQYLIDCTVSVRNAKADKEPGVGMSITEVDGSATVQDGHALRYLPASPQGRRVSVQIYGKNNGIDLSRCEVSLLN